MSFLEFEKIRNKKAIFGHNLKVELNYMLNQQINNTKLIKIKYNF